MKDIRGLAYVVCFSLCSDLTGLYPNGWKCMRTDSRVNEENVT